MSKMQIKVMQIAAIFSFCCRPNLIDVYQKLKHLFGCLIKYCLMYYRDRSHLIKGTRMITIDNTNILFSAINYCVLFWLEITVFSFHVILISDRQL